MKQNGKVTASLVVGQSERALFELHRRYVCLNMDLLKCVKVLSHGKLLCMFDDDMFGVFFSLAYHFCWLC